MITISKISGDEFLTINYDKNNPIEYNDMKILFNTNIVINSYYKLIKINNNEDIYTNLYDIYEMKLKKDIMLDNLNIIFLPYDKKDVEHMKKSNSIFSFNFTNKPIDFPNDDLRNDKLFVLMAVNYNSKYYEKISNELKYDKQIIYNAIMCNSYDCEWLEHIPYEYKNNKEFMKIIVKYNGRNIRYVSNELKNDEELAHLSIKTEYCNGLEYLSNHYKDNEEFIKPLLTKYPRCFEHITKRLQNKKEIIMICIEKLKELKSDENYNKILSLINEINRNDKEIVLPLVSMNGDHISYISGDLSLDKDIVYAAIKNDPTSYKYIDESFFNNKEFILLCLSNNNSYDEENYEDFLLYLHDKFKDDKEIVIASIKKCCKNILYCSKRLKNDKEVILTAINHCYYDFYENMKENEKIIYIKERTKNIDIILNNTSNTRLKNDPDILNQVIKKIRLI